MNPKKVMNAIASGLVGLILVANLDLAQANIVVTAEPKCTYEYPQKTALLIGTQEYKLLERKPSIQGTVNDVNLLANALKTRGFQTTVLTGANATEDFANATWDRLKAKSKCGDHVLLMLTGASTWPSETFRWGFLLEDAQSTKAEGVAEFGFHKGVWNDTSLSHGVTELRMRGVHVTMILDVVGVDSAKLFPPPNGCCDLPGLQHIAPAKLGSLTLLAAPQVATERTFTVNGKSLFFGTFSYLLGKQISLATNQSIRDTQTNLESLFETEVGVCDKRWTWEHCLPYTATTHPDLPFLHTGPIEAPTTRGQAPAANQPPPSAEVLIDSTDGKTTRGGARVTGTQLTGQVKPADGLLALEIAGRRVADVQPDGRFRVEVPLKRGDNDVEVAAMYTNRPHMVRRMTIHSTGGQWQAERPAQSFALLIANERYDKATSGFDPLKTPKADAERLAQELRTRYGFRTGLPRSDGSERPLILHNANRADIFRALDDIARVATPDDAVFVFYAGHGQQLKTALPNGSTFVKTYWVPSDARADNGDADWVSADDINTKIARIRARHVLLVSDSCYAGGLSRSGDDSISLQKAEPDRYLSEMSRKPSRFLLASGGDHPVDDGQVNSPFAQALLSVLRNPPAPAFTLQQVFPELQKRVSNTTNQIPEFPPLRGDAGAAGDGGAMVFFRN